MRWGPRPHLGCLSGWQERWGPDLSVGKLKVPCWFHWPTGSRCEDCAAGFFGNPSEVGGTCQPCQCHHNIDTTDPEACDKETGRCLKCLYHTEGVHCQLCRLGYYGDALQQNCRSKTCSPFAGSSFVGMTSILFLLFLLLFLFLLLLLIGGFYSSGVYFIRENACSRDQISLASKER